MQGTQAMDSRKFPLMLAPTVQRVRWRWGRDADPVSFPEHNPGPTTPYSASTSQPSDPLLHPSHALPDMFATHRASINLRKSYLRLSLNKKLLQPIVAVSCPLVQRTGSLVIPQRCPPVLPHTLHQPHVVYSFSKSNLSFKVHLLQEA